VWIIRIDIYSAIVTFTPVYFHMLYVVHYFIGIYIYDFICSRTLSVKVLCTLFVTDNETKTSVSF
jgi:hypothetical protein